MSDLNKLANLPEYPDDVNLGVPKPFTQHQLVVTLQDEAGNVLDDGFKIKMVPDGEGGMMEEMVVTAKATVPCPKVVVPTADDLRQIILAIGNRYGWEELKALEDALGIFPLSHTWDKKKLDWPEIEWEGKIEAMIEEFKLFPQIKIAEAIAELTPISLELTDPIFGITVDLKKLLEDPEYKGTIVKQMQDKFEELKSMLPDISRENFDGTDGLDSPSLQLNQMFKEMIGELKKMLTESIYYAFLKLIEIFEEIWDALGLDIIPTLIIDILTFDVEGFIGELKEQWKKIKEETGQSFKDFLLEIELPLIGLKVKDLIDMDLKDKKLDIPNWDTQKIINKIGAYFRDFPQKLIEEWMKIVTEFLDAIGLKLPIPIPFDFCMFLEIIGFPKEINLANALTLET